MNVSPAVVELCTGESCGISQAKRCATMHRTRHSRCDPDGLSATAPLAKHRRFRRRPRQKETARAVAKQDWPSILRAGCAPANRRLSDQPKGTSAACRSTHSTNLDALAYRMISPTRLDGPTAAIASERPATNAATLARSRPKAQYRTQRASQSDLQLDCLYALGRTRGAHYGGNRRAPREQDRQKAS